MHLELVELLRCPEVHAPSVLVAAADTIVSRYITDGVLGCPECGAEYAIRSGVTWLAGSGGMEFEGDAPTVAAASLPATTPTIATVHLPVENALRLAAQLGMTEGRDVFVLVGYSLGIVVALREIVHARIVLLNAPDSNTYAEVRTDIIVAPAGIVMSADLSALVPMKFAGVALASAPSDLVMQQALQLLRSGGRLVAPAECAVPNDLRELARDDQVWVAIREAVTSPPVLLTRR